MTKCKPTLYGCYRIIGLTLSLETRFVQTLLKRGLTICINCLLTCKDYSKMQASLELGRISRFGQARFR